MAITYTPAKKEQSPPDFGTKRETMKWSVVDEEKKMMKKLFDWMKRGKKENCAKREG